jgi:hypothetical protein
MNAEFQYDYGDTVRVNDMAPVQFRPGDFGSICGMREKDGVNVYTVEWGSGESMEIPELALEKIE